MNRYFFLFLVTILFWGCKDSLPGVATLKLSDTWKLCSNCQSPNISKIGPDHLLLTYIKSDKNDLDQLVMQTFRNGKLLDPLTITSGKNWFVNWADIPSIVSLNGEGRSLMAHWLQMSAEGTYDYDIRCALSQDDGQSWGESFVLHDDKISAEHGFVTMVSTPKGAFVTWLDGRNTKTPIQVVKEKTKHEDDHGHGSNDHLPMTLRAAWIDLDGKKYMDSEVDHKVCDCCQTDAVMTSTGPVVVYRDRSDQEIRDISIARFINEKWTHKILHKDNWHIAGCPVNGPAVAYQEGLLAVAWYTQMNEIPKVFLAISIDDGNTFADPILIAQDKTIGRVDVSIDQKKDVVVTWMENEEAKTFVSTRIYSSSNAVLSESQQLVRTSSERRAGFPLTEIIDNHLYLIRTTIENDVTSVILETFDGL
jgi:hypothetical protein